MKKGILLACAFSLAIMAAHLNAAAQGVIPPGKEAGAASAPAANPHLLNGYGEQLRPKATRSGPNALYAPIKQPMDEGQVPEIEMFVGESRVFPAPGVGRIAVGNGAILTAAALDGKEVILFANGVGTSSLFVWNDDGRYQRVKINIVPGDTSRYAREIAAFLAAIPKAKASIIGDKVIVEGDDLSDGDLSRVDLLATRYPQIVNFTNRLGFEQMVMIDVKVVEFPVTELRELGLKWGAMGGAAIGGIWSPVHRGNDGPYQITVKTGQDNASPIGPVGGGDTLSLPRSLNILSAVNMGLNATLNALAQEGKTTVLAQPQLSARNGSKASFLAGGEIPYSVSSIYGTSVLFKPYGVKLDILPRVDRNGAIRATIDTEFSQIDSSVTTTGGPALLTRKTSTEFNVKSGETIVLSGLVQRENATNVDKVPFLGDVPVLGALFKSRKFQNKETELAVFVTPTVVDSRSPGVVDRVRKTEERLSDRLGPQPHLIDPLQPGTDMARPDRERGQASAPAPAMAQLPSADAAMVPAHPLAVAPLTPVPFASPQGSALQVTLDGLVLHAAPDEKSEALLRLGRGSVVTLGEEDPQPGTRRDWRHVAVGEMNGWILDRHAQPTKLAPVARQYQANDAATQGAALSRPVAAAVPAEITSLSASSGVQYAVLLDKLALRVAPDRNAAVLRKLPAGQRVNGVATQRRGAWTAVEADGLRGWVATQWLQPVAAKN
jgi:pilus assembly protein CpaC